MTTWSLLSRWGLYSSVSKVTELKSLANHVVVGSVSCEMLDLFCPLPQTLAVDINDLGTVKLNLEVTWRYSDLLHTHTHLSLHVQLFLMIIHTSFVSFLLSSVRLIRMTRHLPPAQFLNACCPIRALQTHPLCESRCFMWVTTWETFTNSFFH